MLDRWMQLCLRIGAGADPSLLYHALESLYAHPPRAYHNLEHISRCLRILDETAPPGAERDLAELALWMHDAVYVPARNDNEERSAAVAGMFAREMGLPDGPAARVRRAVLATKAGATPADELERLVVDVDRSILGAEPEEYRAYAAAIHAEHAHVPFAHYAAGRRDRLRALLAAEHIYSTPDFRDRFESRARQNIAVELRQLDPRPAGKPSRRRNPFPGYSGPAWQ